MHTSDSAAGLTLLALSGSLRSGSYNTALLYALQNIAGQSPTPIELIVFDRMAELPMFNPDREGENISVVTTLKTLLAGSHGLIIASPEYAHGISGPMKNTLDWLVSGSEFINIPIALLNTSPRASHAQAALREVVRTMSGDIVEQASIAIPLLGSELDTAGIVQDPALKAQLEKSLQDFAEYILNTQSQRFS